MCWSWDSFPKISALDKPRKKEKERKKSKDAERQPRRLCKCVSETLYSHQSFATTWSSQKFQKHLLLFGGKCVRTRNRGKTLRENHSPPKLSLLPKQAFSVQGVVTKHKEFVFDSMWRAVVLWSFSFFWRRSPLVLLSKGDIYFARWPGKRARPSATPKRPVRSTTIFYSP